MRSTRYIPTLFADIIGEIIGLMEDMKAQWSLSILQLIVPFLNKETAGAKLQPCVYYLRRLSRQAEFPGSGSNFCPSPTYWLVGTADANSRHKAEASRQRFIFMATLRQRGNPGCRKIDALSSHRIPLLLMA